MTPRQARAVVLLLLSLAAASAAASLALGAADPAAGFDDALQHGDLARALEIARAAADWRRESLAGRPAELAASLDGLALRLLQAASGTAETEAVGEALLRESLDLRRRTLGEDHLDVALSLDSLSTAHFFQGRFDEAEDEERRCLTIRLQWLPDSDRLVAFARYGLGAILIKEGRYAEAEPLLSAAIAVFRTMQPPDPGQLADGLNTLADLYRSQCRFREAEERFQEALRVAETSGEGSRSEQARLANNLAGLYKDEGRYDEAEVLLRRSLALREQAEAADPADLATAWLNLAELARVRGQLQEAGPLYTKALDLARPAFGRDNPELSWFLNQKAVLHQDEERLDAAEPLYRESLDLLRRTLGERHFMVAQSLHDLGGLLRSRGALAESEQVERGALGIRREVYGDRHPDVALTLVELARTLIAMGANSEALAGLDEAVGILEETTAYPEARAEALALRAELRWRADARPKALDDQRAAAALVLAIRPHAGGGEAARAAFLGKHAALFDRLVLWLLEDGRSAAAFEYAERARSRALLDQLQMARVDLMASIPEPLRSALAERERTAAARIAELQERASFTRSRTDLAPEERGRRVGQIQKDLDTADRAYAGIYEEIKNASPLWRNTTGGSPIPLDAAQREVVPPGGLLIMYVIGSEESGLLVLPPPPRPATFHRLEVDRAAAKILGIPAGPLRSRDVARVLGGSGLLASLSRPPAGGAFAEESDRTAAGVTTAGRLQALFRVLVPRRVWSRLKTASEAVVIPDGALHRLPFEALVTKAGRSPVATRYWLDDGPAIRYAASATLLQRIAARGDVDGNRVLSVSDPVYDPAAGAASARAAVLRGRFARASGPLARLPGTARETEAILKAFSHAAADGVTVLQGIEAGEPRVRAALPGNRYIHLATHGLVDQERGDLFAALALAPPAVETGRADDDGFLQLFEIYGLDLSCDLAVLSACGSQVGRAVEGEGVFALSRGFVAAGARRVVASQWSVDDASTALLMEEFFGRIAAVWGDARPAPFTTALRDAKRAVRARQEWAAPFYWSPFVLTGIR